MNFHLFSQLIGNDEKKSLMTLSATTGKWRKFEWDFNRLSNWKKITAKKNSGKRNFLQLTQFH